MDVLDVDAGRIGMVMGLEPTESVSDAVPLADGSHPMNQVKNRHHTQKCLWQLSLVHSSLLALDVDVRAVLVLALSVSLE